MNTNNLNQPIFSNYPVKELFISHSTLAAFESCSRKLEFAKFYNHNLRTRGLASSGGLALHEALGTYIKTRSRQKSILTLLLEYPIDLCDNPLWNWSLERCYSALLALINYLDNHTELEIAIIDGKEAIEVPFIINIKHGLSDFIPVKYRGYIDFIFYNRLTNTYLVIDLKNTEAKTTDFTAEYKFSPQCLPYNMVLAGILGQDFSSLDTRYLIAKLDLLKPQIIELDFNKGLSEVKEWGRDLYMKLVAIKSYYNTQWFPRTSNGCMSWGRPCRFFQVCSTRNVKTLNLMLGAMVKEDEKEFKPWIVLDLELAA